MRVEKSKVLNLFHSTSIASSVTMMDHLGLLATGLSIIIAERRCYALPVPKPSSNESTISSFKEEQGIHQAIALSSLAVLLILHRGLMQTGFHLRRNGFHLCAHEYRPLLGTDVAVGLGI